MKWTSHKIEKNWKTSYVMPILAKIMLFFLTLPYEEYRYRAMQYSTRITKSEITVKFFTVLRS